MVNYKKSLIISMEGVQVDFPKNSLVKILTEQTAGSSTADAMQYNSAVYTVPTDRRYRIRGLRIWLDGTGGGLLTVYEAATEDATTSSKLVIDLPFITNGNYYEFYAEAKINAAKFITIVPSTTTVLHVDIIGYEEVV